MRASPGIAPMRFDEVERIALIAPMLSLCSSLSSFVAGPSRSTASKLGRVEAAASAGSSRAAAALMLEPGTKVDMESIGWEDRTWFKRDPDAPVTDDGACFIVSEDDAPDPEKQWFFCSDPSDDDNMTCELVPEWMSSARRHG